MASENVEDWNQPLPTSSEESYDTGDSLISQEHLKVNNLEKLKKYVELQTYPPVKPPHASTYTENLAKPKQRALVENSKQFPQIMVPKERGERLKRLADKYTTITAEQLQHEIKIQKVKDQHNKDILKRKQEIYYEMLSKLERQCRTNYLNVLINKFANFIAKLATTMPIPPTLVDPYNRMQRGIFCHILLAIGVQPTSQTSIYYNTKEGREYEICHKISHAFLSLIIKALDSGLSRNPDGEQAIKSGFDMDNYLKNRLMCAAEKKVSRKNKNVEETDLNKVLEK